MTRANLPRARIGKANKTILTYRGQFFGKYRFQLQLLADLIMSSEIIRQFSDRYGWEIWRKGERS